MHIVLSQQPGHAHNHTHLEGLSHCNVSHCMLGVKVGYTYWDTTSLAYGVVTSPPSLFPPSFLPLPLFPLSHLFSPPPPFPSSPSLLLLHSDPEIPCEFCGVGFPSSQINAHQVECHDCPMIPVPLPSHASFLLGHTAHLHKEPKLQITYAATSSWYPKSFWVCVFF